MNGQVILLALFTILGAVVFAGLVLIPSMYKGD